MRVFQLLLILLLIGCSKPARENLPSWYYELPWARGVNLPHLYPSATEGWQPISDDFLNEPRFVSNLKGLNAKTFRVPISWSVFSDDDGNLQKDKLNAGVTQIEKLLTKLKPICGVVDVSSSDIRLTPDKALQKPTATSVLKSARNPASVAKTPIQIEKSIQWDKSLFSDKEQERIQTHFNSLNTRNNRSPAAAPSPTPSPQNRCMLILDFHNYLFGQQCGGDGVPKKILQNAAGIIENDNNCVFKSYDHFWKNTNQVRSKQIQFNAEFIKTLENERSVISKNAWITFGIEAINEPMAGSTDSIIDNDLASPGLSITSLLKKMDSTLSKLQNYVNNQQPAQIPKLVQFYKEFLEALDKQGSLTLIAPKALFIFQPFYLDYMDYSLKKWQLVLLPTKDLNVMSKGDYSSMKSLQSFNGKNVYWLAAPHQYYGAFDPIILSKFPEQFVKFLKLHTFPNSFFSGPKLIERLKLMSEHFRTLGMETIIGEYGTGTSLEGGYKANKPIDNISFAQDTPGWQAWISLNHLASMAYLKGELWWRYSQDYYPNEDSYYLLRQKDDSGKTIEMNDQLLKCRKGMPNNHDLTSAVFMLNSVEECPH